MLMHTGIEIILPTCLVGMGPNFFSKSLSYYSYLIILIILLISFLTRVNSAYDAVIKESNIQFPCCKNFFFDRA